jgi:hypothetical protein
MDNDTAMQALQYAEELKQLYAESGMTEKTNYFDELYRVNVSDHVEKKNGFSYVSWPFAVAELRKRHPDATWEVRRFEGMPFMQTPCGYFVEVAVTVNGVTLSQIHPVLDHRNKPISQPNPFDINTAIQRALVKAIALHGLGLYVYAGEDLPPDAVREPDPIPKAAEKALTEAKAGGTKVLKQAWNALSKEDREAVAQHPAWWEQQKAEAAEADERSKAA